MADLRLGDGDDGVYEDGDSGAAKDGVEDVGVEADVAVGEGPVELGRYAVFLEADGSVVIARAAHICDACSKCGCGEQSENIRVPGMIVKMAMNAAKTGKVPGFMKGFTQHG